MASLLLWLCLSNLHLISSTFQQTHFVIGGGIDPAPSNESYGNLQSAGITFLHSDSNQIASVAQAQEMASLCIQHNLSCAPPLSSYKTVAPGAGVWGYFIRDEPRAKDFQGLGEYVAAVRKIHPNALSFINLLGYAGCETIPMKGHKGCAWLYGVDTYEEYVDMFISTVKPDILSYDMYPKSLANMDMFHYNLAFMRNKSLQTGIPFWNYVLMDSNGYGVSAGFYRWQLFISAAYGSRGLMQWSLSPCANKNDCGPKSRWVPYPSLLDKYGHAFKPVFDMAQAEHKPFAILGPLLLQMDSLLVVRTPSSHSPVRITGMPLRSIAAGEGARWLLGHFRWNSTIKAPARTETYEDCVMIVSDDPLHTCFATLDLGPNGPGAVREVDQTDGSLMPVIDAAPDVAGFQLFFLEGSGRLLCWGNVSIMV